MVDARIALIGALGLGALILYARRSQPAYVAPSATYTPYGPVYAEPTYAPQQTTQQQTNFVSNLFDLFGNVADIFTQPSAEQPATQTPIGQSYYPEYDWYNYDYSTPDAIDWEFGDDYSVDYYTPPAEQPASAAVDIWGFSYQPYTPPTVQAMSADQNIAAFLKMIRFAEGTDPNQYGQDPYRITFGYRHILQNMTDHPGNTGEWTGVQTQWGWTSAAGAYQFLKGTWNEVTNSFGLSTDFSPASQDLHAVKRIQQRGALEDVKAGRFQAALDKLGNEWASLPTSTSGQPQRRVDEIAQVYLDAGGNFA